MYSRLPSLYLARAHRQVRGFALERLNSRHFIQADGAFPYTNSLGSIQVGLTNVANFGIKVMVWGGDSASILTDVV